MAETINKGTILIKDGIFLPDALRFESEPCATGWRLVKNLDGYGLGRKISEAGWSFFWLAGEIGATVFGFDGQKTVRRAVKRILGNLKSGKFGEFEPDVAARIIPPLARLGAEGRQNSIDTNSRTNTNWCA